MKKLITVLGLIIGLLALTTGPAMAEFSISGDYAVGDMETQFHDGLTTVISPADLSGVILGFGYTRDKFLFNYDFIYAGLDQSIAGSDVNRLHDLRAGYRFYQSDSFNVAALLSYIYDSGGDFKASGLAIGIGAEYFFDDQWSVYGRIGYSPFGITVEDNTYEYDDATLIPAAVGVNYQATDRWSFHIGYRYYAFSGDMANNDLDSQLKLYSLGFTYKFPGAVKVSEPAPVPAPQPAPTPAPEPKAPAPAPAPQPAPAPAPEPIVPAPAPTPAPEPTPAPAAKPEDAVKERQKIVNEFLQPIFFDFDKAALRSNQIPVLEKDLQILLENADLNILIGGHADPKGANDYNLRLSQRRAETIRQWLIERGIAAERFTIAAYGEENLYFDQATEPGWESDRWVDIIVTDEIPTKEMGIRK